jgi:dihydrofolate synthase/folylpolyglutamate synthase
VSYRERIVVDGGPLERSTFGTVLREVLTAADRVAGPHGAPTEFEVLTAAGFLALARHRVRVAVVEVGLGGRLDATNAADLGVAAITTVQHDHERHLGRTLAAIGTEKAAIIKAGDLAVSGATGRGQAPIEQRSRAVGAALTRVGPHGDYRATLRDLSWAGTVVDLETPGGSVPDLLVGLVGSHQAHNAAVAMAVLDSLYADAARRGNRLALDPPAVRRGLAEARWPGRLERLATPAGAIVLDGAHNPAGARVLVETLTALGVHDMPLVFGAMSGKRVTEVLRRLAALRPRPVFTAVADSHALPPERLVRTWRTVTGIDRGPRAGTVAPDPARALDRAEDLRHGEQPIVVSGSLYLVGAVRARLIGEEPDQ